MNKEREILKNIFGYDELKRIASQLIVCIV